MTGIDLKSPFDDDSHTLHDGALHRFFRMRKWMFATAVVLLLLDLKWWDYSATAKALSLQALPEGAVHFALTAAGVYLLVQAILIAVQIAGTYAYSLEVRAALIRLPGDDIRRKQYGELFSRHEALCRERERLRALEGAYPQTLDRQIKELEVQLNELHQAGLYRIGMSKALRQATLTSEALLDMMRLLPMPVFLLYATVAHGYWTAPSMS